MNRRNSGQHRAGKPAHSKKLFCELPHDKQTLRLMLEGLHSFIKKFRSVSRQNVRRANQGQSTAFDKLVRTLESLTWEIDQSSQTKKPRGSTAESPMAKVITPGFRLAIRCLDSEVLSERLRAVRRATRNGNRSPANLKSAPRSF
jgi:hypothetical protein